MKKRSTDRFVQCALFWLMLQLCFGRLEAAAFVVIDRKTTTRTATSTQSPWNYLQQHRSSSPLRLKLFGFGNNDDKSASSTSSSPVPSTDNVNDLVDQLEHVGDTMRQAVASKMGISLEAIKKKTGGEFSLPDYAALSKGYENLPPVVKDASKMVQDELKELSSVVTQIEKSLGVDLGKTAGVAVGTVAGSSEPTTKDTISPPPSSTASSSSSSATDSVSASTPPTTPSSLSSDNPQVQKAVQELEDAMTDFEKAVDPKNSQKANELLSKAEDELEKGIGDMEEALQAPKKNPDNVAKENSNNVDDIPKDNTPAEESFKDSDNGVSNQVVKENKEVTSLDTKNFETSSPPSKKVEEDSISKPVQPKVDTDVPEKGPTVVSKQEMSVDSSNSQVPKDSDTRAQKTLDNKPEASSTPKAPKTGAPESNTPVETPKTANDVDSKSTDTSMPSSSSKTPETEQIEAAKPLKVENEAPQAKPEPEIKTQEVSTLDKKTSPEAAATEAKPRTDDVVSPPKTDSPPTLDKALESNAAQSKPQEIKPNVNTVENKVVDSSNEVDSAVSKGDEPKPLSVEKSPATSGGDGPEKLEPANQEKTPNVQSPPKPETDLQKIEEQPTGEQSSSKQGEASSPSTTQMKTEATIDKNSKIEDSSNSRLEDTKPASAESVKPTAESSLPKSDVATEKIATGKVEHAESVSNPLLDSNNAASTTPMDKSLASSTDVTLAKTESVISSHVLLSSEVAATSPDLLDTQSETIAETATAGANSFLEAALPFLESLGNTIP